MTYDEWVIQLVAWVCTHPDTLRDIGVSEVSELAYLLSEMDRMKAKDKANDN